MYSRNMNNRQLMHATCVYIQSPWFVENFWFPCWVLNACSRCFCVSDWACFHFLKLCLDSLLHQSSRFIWQDKTWLSRMFYDMSLGSWECHVCCNVGPTGQWDRSHVLPCFYIVGPVGNVLTRVTLRLLCDLRHHAAEHNCRADCGLLPNAEAWEILKQNQRDLIVYPDLWVWLFDVSKAWAHGQRVQFGDVTWQL